VIEELRIGSERESGLRDKKRVRGIWDRVPSEDPADPSQTRWLTSSISALAASA